jgi:hypothetical protein
MTAIFKAIAWIIFESIKHYAPKIKKTTIDSDGVGKREERLKDKIKNRWKEK